MNDFNPKLKAVVTIRNLASGIANDWNDLTAHSKEIDRLVQNAFKIISKTSDKELEKIWISGLNNYLKNITSLSKILHTVKEKINLRQALDVQKTWDEYHRFVDELQGTLSSLQQSDVSTLPSGEAQKLSDLWKEINLKLDAILGIADACSVQLGLIEALAPEEVDDITHTILKHMPKSYNISQAEQYEKEYMEAYESLKAESSKKKNLWDKFLDALAGGVQQSPAERVMMQRWVSGEKGDL